MYNLIKDLINPKNWIKLLLNPKKIKTVYDRIFYYPGLKFGYSKSNLNKKILINCTIFLAKRNKQFKEFFFSENENKLNHKIFHTFKNNIFDENHINSLRVNGIIVLEDVLSEKEHINFQTDFNENAESEFSKTVLGKSSEILMKKIDKKFSEQSDLISISNKITKIIYGKIVKPTYHYMYAKCLSVPESVFPGDNILHVDRFLPNLKLVYFPFEVKPEGAPFKYALGSHKINKNYLNFFKNNKEWIFDERNPNSKQFFTNVKEIPVKANSLVLALTNGFHSRTPFKKATDRAALFLNYPNFNLISLLFPKN